ncbi:MAG TPA: hypothetical protein VFN05_11650, partial [Actinomycetes bacterium]|nr:hypothetical protein [Actinomycetes bacterium]
PIAQPLNTKPKYVASKTLTEPLAWQNSTLLQGDVAEAVAALKQQDGEDLHVIVLIGTVIQLLALVIALVASVAATRQGYRSRTRT